MTGHSVTPTSNGRTRQRQMLDIGTVSNRLKIRKLAASNVGSEYVAWLNDPLVNQYLESRFQEHTLASTKEYVQLKANDESVLLAGIYWTDTGEHIGNIKLEPIDWHHQSAEIGILIGNQRF